MNTTPFTKGPWTICWQTYNGRRTNFHITASPYGSVRPLARTDWKIEWSEVEGDELVANANLMGASPELYEALKAVLPLLPMCFASVGRPGYADHRNDALDAARTAAISAIAKAEGRS